MNNYKIEYGEDISKEKKRMPNKTRHIMLKVLQDIKEGVFNQMSVELMLIKSRDFYPDNSILEDLANFIAHPARDRGFMKEDIDTYIDLINTISELGRENDGPLVIPEPWYKRLVSYYRDIKPNKKMIDKINKIFEKDGNKYICEWEISGYTASRIKESISREGNVPVASISEKHIKDEIDWLLQNINFVDGEHVRDENWEDIVVCILCSLHGCELISSDGEICTCFLGFSPEEKLQLFARFGEGLESNNRFGIKSDWSISHTLIDTEIEYERYISRELEKEYLNNQTIEHESNPINARRGKNGDLYIERYKVYSVNEIMNSKTL